MSGKLTGKRVLVTGASAGMGEAIALRMAAEGAAGLVVHGRDRERLEKVRKEAMAAGAKKVLALVADLGDVAKARQLVHDAIAGLGRLDVVICNAGDTTSEDYFKTDTSTVEYIFRVDFTAGFVMAQEAAKNWIQEKSGGVLLYNAAQVEKGGLPHNPVYSAAKAATLNLVKSLAPKFGPYGIRINCVTPGFCERTRVYSSTASPTAREKVGTELPKVIPLRRLGTPEDIAAAFAFLASDDASYITGTNLVVDGGISAGSVAIPWLEAIQGRLKYE